MIEPVIDALTTVIRPAWSAKNAMISSAMLPNVALRMPPICGPVIAPSRSVASPTTHASPRIPSADTRNSGVPSTWNTTSRTIAMTAMATVASTPIRAPRPSGPRIGIPDPVLTGGAEGCVIGPPSYGRRATGRVAGPSRRSVAWFSVQLPARDPRSLATRLAASPRATPDATSRSTASRAASTLSAAASLGSPGGVPDPTTMTTSPRAGMAPPAAASASDASVPREIVS